MWRLSLNSDPTSNIWTQVSIGTVPLSTIASDMVYVPEYDVIFLFGTDGGGQSQNHWVFAPSSGSLSANQIAAGCATPNDWTAITPSNGNTYGTHHPLGSNYPVMRAIGNGKVLMYGGQTGGAVHQNDVWQWDVPSRVWTKKNPASPPPLTTQLASGSPPWAFNSATGKMFYHQTHSTGAPRTWMYDPTANTWTALITNGGGPASEAYMTYDAANGKLIAFCRESGSGDLEWWIGTLSCCR